ncbi:MAG: hypothetical protein EXR05_11675 [Acetobacteraceae bacterium]|nr:hypothetical protein [Acetobacteraceae bacterium]MSP30417.1 hypothetical protein [Acetobacteraceae bacterium]
MAELIVLLAKVYLLIGVGVAILFLLLGIERVNPAAHGAYAFQPSLLPSLTLLWPYVLRRGAESGFFRHATAPLEPASPDPARPCRHSVIGVSGRCGFLPERSDRSADDPVETATMRRKS